MSKLLPPDVVEKTLKGVVIPAKPQALIQIEAELRKDNPEPRVIVRIVGSDVGLSAAVLKTVNSPFFALSRKISSVTQAVALLA
jgi:HD-like signal output (HDOD) protein